MGGGGKKMQKPPDVNCNLCIYRRQKPKAELALSSCSGVNADVFHHCPVFEKKPESKHEASCFMERRSHVVGKFS